MQTAGLTHHFEFIDSSCFRKDPFTYFIDFSQQLLRPSLPSICGCGCKRVLLPGNAFLLRLHLLQLHHLCQSTDIHRHPTHSLHRHFSEHTPHTRHDSNQFESQSLEIIGEQHHTIKMQISRVFAFIFSIHLLVVLIGLTESIGSFAIDPLPTDPLDSKASLPIVNLIRTNPHLSASNHHEDVANQKLGAVSSRDLLAADDPLVGRSVAEAIRKPKHSDDGSGDEEDEFNGDDEKPLDDDDDEETDADNEDEEDDDLNGENGDTDDIDKKDSNRSTDMKDDFEEDTEDETIDTHEKPTHKTDPMGPSGGELEGSGDGEDDENDDEDDDKLDTDDEESGATNHKFNIAGSNMPTKAPSDNLKPDTTLVTSGPELKKPSIPIEVDRPRLNSEETDDHSQPKPPTHTTATDDEDEDDGDKDKDDREDDKDEDETEKPIVPPKTIDTTTFDHHDNNRVDNSRIDSARPETPTWSSRPDWTSQSVPPSRPIDTTNDNSILVFGRHNWANTVSLFAQPTILAAIIVSAVLGLLISIVLVMCIIYRMISKDDESYEATKNQIHTTYGRANHKENRYP